MFFNWFKEKKPVHNHDWQVVKIISGIFAKSWFGKPPSRFYTQTVAKCLQCRTCGERKLDANEEYMDASPSDAMKAYNWLYEGEDNV